MESRNGVEAVEEKPRGEVGQGKRGQQGGHAYLVMLGVMMVFMMMVVVFMMMVVVFMMKVVVNHNF